MGNSFHVDHAASLPYVMTKTNFRGRVFMTHATKAIYKWLIQDSVRVRSGTPPLEGFFRVGFYADTISLAIFMIPLRPSTQNPIT